jgi:hypothetical protein
MDKTYMPIYRQAAALQQQFHTMSAGAAHQPGAISLRNEIHHLTNDLATNKNPRTIEHRLHTIQTQLKLAQTIHPGMMQQNHTGYAGHTGGSQFLTNHQTSELHRHFEMMRHDVRMNPHY